MYKENILEHWKNPRNFGKLQNADSVAKEVNTLCGDEIQIEIRFNSSHVKEIAFSGQGCAISQATASILTEFVKNKSVEEIKEIRREDILEMLGIPISPIRLKCALISLDALKSAASKYENGK